MENADPSRSTPGTRSLDEDFLAFAAQGELRVPVCARTGRVLSYAERPAPAEVTWQPASGLATLHSFTVYWQAYDPAWPVPYHVAWIELDEGPRLVSQVAGVDHGSLRIGMRLRARFESGGRLVFDPYPAVPTETTT